MQDPLFLIWLGTCDLMKIGARKRISLRGMEIPQLRAALLEMKTKVLAINKSSHFSKVPHLFDCKVE